MMKTTLIILMASVIFLIAPVMASAAGNHGRDNRDSYKVYTEKNYGQHKHKDWKKVTKQQAKQKNHLKRELRQTRHELRQTKRELRHEKRYDRRPAYVQSGLILGLPHVVFRFGW
jgi:hypothetical protein